jgi:hypothetical protein
LNFSASADIQGCRKAEIIPFEPDLGNASEGKILNLVKRHIRKKDMPFFQLSTGIFALLNANRPGEEAARLKS